MAEPLSADPRAAQRAAELTEDVDNLRHMLGARPTDNRREWGYRNYYCANRGDESMSRLELSGMVIRGREAGETVYFHATEAGCKVAGLNEKQTRKALSRE